MIVPDVFQELGSGILQHHPGEYQLSVTRQDLVDAQRPVYVPCSLAVRVILLQRQIPR